MIYPTTNLMTFWGSPMLVGPLSHQSTSTSTDVVFTMNRARRWVWKRLKLYLCVFRRSLKVKLKAEYLNDIFPCFRRRSRLIKSLQRMLNVKHTKCQFYPKYFSYLGDAKLWVSYPINHGFEKVISNADFGHFG